MSLKNIKTGSPPSPLRILIYGTPGIGKTTFAANIPGALFLTCEDGGGDLDYARVDVGSWAALVSTLEEADRDGLPEGFRAIVLDTINGYAEKCGEFVCNRARVDSLEEVGGGFGKGFTAVQEEQAKVRDLLDRIRVKHSIHIVLIGHAHVKTFNDPTGPSFDRYMLRMNEKVASVWTAWADVVGFATMNVIVKGGKRGKEIDDPMAKGKATSGERMIYLSSDASYEAKNRYSLPDELPLSWPAFAKAIGWAKREEVLTPKPVTRADVEAALVAALAGADVAAEDAAAFLDSLEAKAAGDWRKVHGWVSGAAQAKLLKGIADARPTGGK